jgi:hypothetical protein
VAFPIRLLIQALKGAILAEINQIVPVFSPQDITTTATQGLTMGWPPLSIFSLDHVGGVVSVNDRQRGFFGRDPLLSLKQKPIASSSINQAGPGVIGS